MHYKNGREAKNGDKVVLIPVNECLHVDDVLEAIKAIPPATS